MKYMILTILLVFYPLISYAKWDKWSESLYQKVKKGAKYNAGCKYTAQALEYAKKNNLSSSEVIFGYPDVKEADSICFGTDKASRDRILYDLERWDRNLKRFLLLDYITRH